MPGVEYPVFLVYGFMPFLVFKAVCLQIVDGVNAGQGLLAYRQVLLMDLFVAKTLTFCVIQSVVFAIVIVGLALLGYEVLPDRPIEFAAVLCLSTLLAFGLGIVFAALASQVPDARPVVHVMFMPLYFISGILFPVTRFPDEWLQWLAVNPVLHLVEMSRSMAIDSYVPMKYTSIEYPVGLMLISISTGLMLYRKRILTRVTQ